MTPPSKSPSSRALQANTTENVRTMLEASRKAIADHTKAMGRAGRVASPQSPTGATRGTRHGAAAKRLACFSQVAIGALVILAIGRRPTHSS